MLQGHFGPSEAEFMDAAQVPREQLAAYQHLDWYKEIVAPHPCLVSESLDDEEEASEDDEEDDLLARMERAGFSAAPTPSVRGSSAARSRGRSRTSRSRPIASESSRVAAAERSPVRSLAGEGSDEEEEAPEEEDEDVEMDLAAPGETIAEASSIANLEVVEAPRPAEKKTKAVDKAAKIADSVLADGTRKPRANRNACNDFYEHAPAGITVRGRYTQVSEMVRLASIATGTIR